MVAIGSFSVECGKKNHPSINTNLAPYLPWIIQSVQELETKPWNDFTIIITYTYIAHRLEKIPLWSILQPLQAKKWYKDTNTEIVNVFLNKVEIN